MSAPRFHVPLALVAGDAGREIVLPEAAAHHALRVLRLGTGDALTLFTGDGGEIAATLVRADKRSAWVRLEAFDPIERESPLAVTLVQAIAANYTTDFVVRKAVEMGAAEIRLVVSERGARFPDGERGARRLAHWRQIAQAACEQCGRNRIPPVHEVQPLSGYVTSRAARAGILLAPDATATLPTLPAPVGGIDVMIGPEGGFSPEEIARAGRAGITAMRMVARVMRTETAGIAVLAALNTLWGDMR
jgi:16S rRNA (uracil1498-N3)-methyltransferase